MSQGLIKIKAKKKTFGKLNELFFPSQKKEKKEEDELLFQSNKFKCCCFSPLNLTIVTALSFYSSRKYLKSFLNIINVKKNLRE